MSDIGNRINKIRRKTFNLGATLIISIVAYKFCLQTGNLLLLLAFFNCCGIYEIQNLRFVNGIQYEIRLTTLRTL